jgi:hypothetical protein
MFGALFLHFMQSERGCFFYMSPGISSQLQYMNTVCFKITGYFILWVYALFVFQKVFLPDAVLP